MTIFSHLYHIIDSRHLIVVLCATSAAKEPKRLAGPGMPSPSPEGPDPWRGPLIGAARSVRVAERVVGSVRWGGLMMDQAGAT